MDMITCSDAVASGAVAVVTQQHVDVGDGIVQINVTNTRMALSRLSNCFFSQTIKKDKSNWRYRYKWQDDNFISYKINC